MFKRWQKTLNSFNRLLDILLLFASYFIGTHLWLVVIRKTSDNLALTLSNTVWYALGLAIIIVCLYQLAGLYDYVRAKPFSYDISRVVLVNAIAAISTGALLFILRQIDFSRGVIIFYFLFSCIFVICKRALMRNVLNYYRSKGYNKKHVILIGTGELAKMYAETIRENPRFGYVIDGYIGTHDNLTGLTYFGEWERVGSDLLSKPGIDEVVAALDQDHLFVLPQIISATEKFGTKVSIIPYFHNYIPASTTFEIFGDCKLLNMRSTPLDYPGNAVLKRVLD
jgi:FlaA1/EpsC-like NDP-sugar epimerase